MSTFRLDLHSTRSLVFPDKVMRVYEIIVSYVPMPGIEKQNQVSALAAFMKNAFMCTEC